MKSQAVYGLGAALVAAAFVSPVTSHEIAPDPTKPSPPQTQILVEIQRPAKMIGYPAVCPGSGPDENQDEILCMAELYEAPVRVLQHIGGERTTKWLNIRFTAHSFSAVWKKDRRFLLSVFPFNDDGRKGHFAYSWDWENDDGEFCVDKDNLAKAAEPMQKFYEDGRTTVTGNNNPSWSSGVTLRCTKGRLSQGR